MKLNKLTTLLTAAICSLLITLPLTSNASETVDITIPTQSGDINTADFRGQVLYLDFWASWCIPCKKSFPWMNGMHEKYEKDGLKIIAINVDKDSSFALEFLKAIPAQFEIGYDHKGELAELFEVPAMPTAYIVNRKGELVHAHYGFKQAKVEEYEASIVEALGAKE